MNISGEKSCGNSSLAKISDASEMEIHGAVYSSSSSSEVSETLRGGFDSSSCGSGAQALIKSSNTLEEMDQRLDSFLGTGSILFNRIPGLLVWGCGSSIIGVCGVLLT